jgi:hypothetical protein
MVKVLRFCLDASASSAHHTEKITKPLTANNSRLDSRQLHDLMINGRDGLQPHLRGVMIALEI